MLSDVDGPQNSKEAEKEALLGTIELVLDRGLDVNAETDSWEAPSMQVIDNQTARPSLGTAQH